MKLPVRFLLVKVKAFVPGLGMRSGSPILNSLSSFLVCPGSIPLFPDSLLLGECLNLISMGFCSILKSTLFKVLGSAAIE